MQRSRSFEDGSFQVKKLKPAQLRAGFAKLPEDLREAADEIYCLSLRWAASDARLKFEIGRVVSWVSAESAYGDRGVREIARALGCSADKLYACKRVAEAWPEGIDKFFPSEEEARRLPVTFSHLAELARVEHGRDELLKEVQERGLTIQQLRDRIGSPKRPAKTKAAAAAGVKDEPVPIGVGSPELGEEGDAGGAAQASDSSGLPQWLAGVVDRIERRIDEDEQYVARFREALQREGKSDVPFDRGAATEKVTKLMERKAAAHDAMQRVLTEILDVLGGAHTRAA